MATNTLSVGNLPHFNPKPFPLLDTGVALEAILLASFILMRQSGLAKRADDAVVRMNQQIAEHFGLLKMSKDEEIKELGRPTSVDAVAATIQEKPTNE
jgi:uncharacterized membrane protein